MDCKEAEPFLLDQADGLLDAASAPAVRRHLAACPRCRERQQWLAASRSAFRTLRPEQPSPAFDRRLRERLDRLERDRRVLRRLHLPSALLLRGVHFPQPVLAALVGLLALGLTWTIWGPRTVDAPPHLPLRIAFERAILGELPAGWAVPPPAAAAGYAAAAVADADAPGGRGVRLRASSSTAPGELIYGVDAAALGGKAVRFRAPLRVQGEGARARLVLRMVPIGGAIEGPAGAAEQTSEAVSASTWTSAEVAAEIPSGTERLELGLRIEGGGTAWIGPAVLEPAGGGR
jgi:anti-sigma factor RsiW